MRSIGGILRGFFILSLAAAVASAVAASVARRRIVSRGAPYEDDVDLVAIYDGLDFASTAPALRRVAVTAWYGGGTIDLRGATLDPAGAVMTVRAAFGGCRLLIPETWRVELRVKGIFGGVADARASDLVDPDGPLLAIEGFAIFGGMGIVAEAPHLEERATEEPVPQAAAPA